MDYSHPESIAERDRKARLMASFGCFLQDPFIHKALQEGNSLGSPSFRTRRMHAWTDVFSSLPLDSFPILGTRMGDGPMHVFHVILGSVWRPVDATWTLVEWETGSNLAT